MLRVQVKFWAASGINALIVGSYVLANLTTGENWLDFIAL